MLWAKMHPNIYRDIAGCHFLNQVVSFVEDDVFIEWNGHNNGFEDKIGEVTILDLWRTIATEQEIIDYVDPIRTIITPWGMEVKL